MGQIALPAHAYVSLQYFSLPARLHHDKSESATGAVNELACNEQILSLAHRHYIITCCAALFSKHKNKARTDCGITECHCRRTLGAPVHQKDVCECVVLLCCGLLSNRTSCNGTRKKVALPIIQILGASSVLIILLNKTRRYLTKNEQPDANASAACNANHHTVRYRLHQQRP